MSGHNPIKQPDPQYNIMQDEDGAFVQEDVDILENMIDQGDSDDTLTDNTQRSRDNSGEFAVSGDTTDPEADDDMLANSHDMGLRLGEDYGNPQPLNIAKDFQDTEDKRHGPPDNSDDIDELE